MKNLHFRPIWGLVVTWLIVIIVSFCIFDRSGMKLNIDNMYFYNTQKYIRKVDLYPIYVKVTKRPNSIYPKLPMMPLDYSVDQSRQVAYTKGGLEIGKKAYSDNNWTIWDVPPFLLGAAHIKPRYRDRHVNDTQFMKIDYNTNIEDIYIAYDASEG